MGSVLKHLKHLSLLGLFFVAAFSISYVSKYLNNFPSVTNFARQESQRLTPLEPAPLAEPSVFPHQHVYYLKTHKTGSTTVYSILAEYSRAHELVPLLPKGYHINQGGMLRKTQLMTINKIKKYDMVFSHHVYSPDLLNYLHNDSYRISSLREPFDNFVSAFYYYRNKFHNAYLLKVGTNDPLTEFLRHREKYEINGYTSWTNNRQSMDMGWNLQKNFSDTQYMHEFIKECDRRFDLVLIMEYFDESLIMMKRALRWNTEDMVYFTKNAGHYRKKDLEKKTELEVERRELHAKFSQPDIMLYKHFLKRFKDKMAKEAGLQEEVEEFQKILLKFSQYCETVGETNEKLVIPATRWTNRFQITRIKCQLLTFNFDKLTDFIQSRQRALFF